MALAKRSVLRIAIFVVVGAVLCILVYFGPGWWFISNHDETAGLPHLKVGGTSSALFMIDAWKKDYLKEKNTLIDFDDSGSTKGIESLIQKEYMIGYTHAPLTEEQKQKAREKGGEVVHIPVMICAVVPIYNLPTLKGKPPLNLTGEVLAKIFLGVIKTWDDPQIGSLQNKDVNLPSLPIEVVAREDSSGTTSIFADYLHSIDPALWEEKIKAKPGSTVAWPGATVRLRNNGVASYVGQKAGSIGYVDLLHAIAHKRRLDYASLQSQDALKSQEKSFIHVEAKNMTAAAEGLGTNIPDDLTINLLNKPGKNTYPICSAVWAVCYQKQPAGQQKMVVDFLTWATHEGQKSAEARAYAPLPTGLVGKVEQKLNSIQTAQ